MNKIKNLFKYIKKNLWTILKLFTGAVAIVLSLYYGLYVKLPEVINLINFVTIVFGIMYTIVSVVCVLVLQKTNGFLKVKLIKTKVYYTTYYATGIISILFVCYGQFLLGSIVLWIGICNIFAEQTSIALSKIKKEVESDTTEDSNKG